MKSKNTMLKTIFYLLIFLPFFKPVGLCNITIFNNIFQLLKILSILVIFVMAIKKYKRINIKIIAPLIIFWIIYIVNSIFNKAISFELLNNAVSSIAVIIMIFMFDDIKEFYGIIRKLIYFELLLQILSFVFVDIFDFKIFQNELGKLYFLGGDNYSAFYVIPMLSILFASSFALYGRLKVIDILIGVVLFLFYLHVKSYTSFFSFMIFSFIIYMNRNKKENIKVYNKLLIMILFVLLILIVFFNIQNIFSYCLNHIGKGITLNSRTIIWDKALTLIEQNFLFGHGNIIDVSKYLYGASHAHNFFLEIVLRTGVVGLILYLYFIFKCTKTEMSTKTDYYYLAVGLFSYMILSFMDFYPFITCQYILLGLMYRRKNNSYVVKYAQNTQ